MHVPFASEPLDVIGNSQQSAEVRLLRYFPACSNLAAAVVGLVMQHHRLGVVQLGSHLEYRPVVVGPRQTRVELHAAIGMEAATWLLLNVWLLGCGRALRFARSWFMRVTIGARQMCTTPTLGRTELGFGSAWHRQLRKVTQSARQPRGECQEQLLRIIRRGGRGYKGGGG